MRLKGFVLCIEIPYFLILSEADNDLVGQMRFSGLKNRNGRKCPIDIHIFFLIKHSVASVEFHPVKPNCFFF